VISRLGKRWVGFGENGGFALTPGPSPGIAKRRKTLCWLLLFLLLAGLPILVHGCHRDEDNELFVPLIRHTHDRGTGQ
jgi:hypothetical protein